ncbi:UDP-N-acetylglucosamine 2-epimerase (non-hydrolyzing) [Actinoplanes sp. KI2]|uniref:non-hydrolyzing UDP-N-acetylglucosamine 2-epimerase n=1 Tax=Actinoplanes sp. KI2 TaxID=2983315 RepID=UPI0021D59990|nr:UDP-N-acetylglucosamine 2-epimerase (non-hydrolyzing) [Actinoplanes sp. KI2]MCU7724176.1 UDP-N-acetylglucosamine 2-epimerase (non-hydrolyzing) [Actinoplanes sp. KI2]
MTAPDLKWLERKARPRRADATVHRRRLVLLEMATAVVGCVVGYRLLVGYVQHFEVALASHILHFLGVDRISGALGDSFVVFGPGMQPVVAELTGSCTILSSVLALTALAAVALRQRPQALPGLLIASVFVLVANQVRLVLSLLAGRYFAVDALIFFHDWVGATLNFAYILFGLLIMIGMTMYDRQLAEQDRSGRHTADRPAAWARPGLGHRVPVEGEPKAPRVRVASLVHRKVLPKGLSKRLAQKRERRRIDYRVGHESTARRAEIIRGMAAKGLSVHTATLLAVASYETEPMVLDALADAVAERQWEPLHSPDVLALRLWARAWLMRAPEKPRATGRLIAVTGAGGPAGVAVIRALRAAGEEVLALDASPDAAGLRLANRAAVVPLADKPEFADAVLAVLAEHRPAALVCTVAEEYAALTPLADRFAELGTKTWLPEHADVCLDKVAFAEALHAAGVPHPVTASTPQDASRVPGPWVVKPARGRGSRDVMLVDDPDELALALAAVPGAIVQNRLTGREFTADALIDRDGTMVVCVPRWRDETKGGISVQGTTFTSDAVTEAVAATLRAVRHTGPANVQGFVADSGEVTIVEVNPRFSGGLPLTLAAGADVVNTYVKGILEPDAKLPALEFQAGLRMARHYAEVFYPVEETVTPAVTIPTPITPAVTIPTPITPVVTTPVVAARTAPATVEARPVSRRIMVPFGTRPEVIKLAPVVHALRAAGHHVTTVDTGQHQVAAMSTDVQRALGLTPDVRLTPAAGPSRLAALVTGATEALTAHPADVVLALGDTHTVPAYALAARGAGVPFAHLEAGLRSFNPRSLEEINRRVAATTAQIHFAPTERAAAFLAGEGIAQERIFVVGNPVVDVLRERGIEPVPPADREGVLVTAHRASNVDDPARLERLVDVIGRLAAIGPVRFPIHPRTRARLTEHRLLDRLTALSGVVCEDPLPYDELLPALAHSRIVVTDSGGLQEEAAFLGVPVVVLRRSTPRWEGVETGAAVLTGISSDFEADRAVATARRLSSAAELARIAELPCPYGDGHTGTRIAQLFAESSMDALLALDEPDYTDGRLPWAI